MSFDAIPRPPSRSPTKPEPTLEEAIARLVVRPSNSSASEALSRIQQQTSSFDQIVRGTERINELWDHPSGSDDLTAVRAKLLGDAISLNNLVQDQLEIANNSQLLLSELNDAWSAAELNAEIARDMYQRAKLPPNEREELLRLQARCALLEKEQDIKELIADQHKELLDHVTLSAAERQELERLRAQAVTDLSSKVDGIQLTTDGIAQSISSMVNAEQLAGQDPKRRNISGLSSSGEAIFASPAAGQRRPSLPMPTREPLSGSPLGVTRSRRSSDRLSLPSPVQPSAEVSGAAQSATETPESNLGPPPSSAAEPAIGIDDHKKPDSVFANILAWDGQDLFDKTELPATLTTLLEDLIKNELCSLDASDFHKAFKAGLNAADATCVWQRIGGSRVSTGFHACHDCITKKRPCLIRIKDVPRGRQTRPHLAPLPERLRPQGATRRDPEYWVVPTAQS